MHNAELYSSGDCGGGGYSIRRINPDIEWTAANRYGRSNLEAHQQHLPASFIVGRETWYMRTLPACVKRLVLSASGYEEEAFEEGRRYGVCTLRYLPESARFLVVVAYGVSMLDSYSDAINLMIKEQDQIRVQMEANQVDIQGISNQSSSQEGNTIITRDAGETTPLVQDPGNATVDAYCSTEKIHKFEDLVGRWMPYKSLKVATTDVADATLLEDVVPQALFSSLYVMAPNLLPFETFVFGKYDVEFKFVVNANKFQCGKLVVSAMLDSYRAANKVDNLQTMLTRPHIIIDLSANAEGTITVPFIFHRAFVRNLKVDFDTLGVQPAWFATLYVKVLSQLRTGANGIQDMYVRVFYRFVDASFAGMSYRVAVQMETALAGAAAVSCFRTMITDAEKTVKILGKIGNRDKPSQLVVSRMVPEARPNLCSGVGLEQVVPLRLDPTQATNYHVVQPISNEPETVMDVAKIWGCRSRFMWKSTDVTGSAIASLQIDPASRGYQIVSGHITPMEYVANMFQFWSGTIEIRVDFVSNAFHTGSVMLSAEYVRKETTNDAADLMKSASTYTKTFHLGEQKSVEFRVPFISDTVWKRTTQPTWGNDWLLIGSESTRSKRFSVFSEAEVFFKVRVVNELRPVPSASQEIECLVFWRAGPDMMFHGLKPTYVWRAHGEATHDRLPSMDNFPADNYAHDSNPDETLEKELELKKGKQFVAKLLEIESLAGHPSRKQRIKQLFPKANMQMDYGDKEAVDPTGNFRVGPGALEVQTGDGQHRIKDILRRSVMVMSNQKVPSTTDGKSAGFFIPLMPPSKSWCYYKTDDTGVPFSPTLSQTPHAALMDLFRFWRGSMRYTIIMHNGSNLYVTALPHSGVRLIGSVDNAEANGTFQIHGCGFATAVMSSSVNGTMTVEVPYDTELNWTTTWDEDPEKNYTWRDKGDTNAGHLVLTARESCYVDVWWSAGDDFQFSNYVGMPGVGWSSASYCWDDHAGRFPKVQMEFARETVKNVTSLVQPTFVARTLLGSVPFVGPGVGVATIMNVADQVKAETGKANQVFSEIGSSLCSTSRKFDGVADKVGAVVDQLGSVMEVFSAQLSAALSQTGSVVENAMFYSSMVVDLMVDLFSAWSHSSWALVGSIVVKLLAKVVGMRCVSKVMEWANQGSQLFQQLFDTQTVRVQMDETLVARFVGLVCGIVGTALHVTLDLAKYGSFAAGCLRRITDASGVSYLVNVMKFFESVFGMMKEMIMDALGYVDPTSRALKLLSGKDVQLATFVSSAQAMTSEANAHLLSHPQFRTRFWYTVVQAYQIQKLMLVAGGNPASAPLFRLCNEVIKVSNEKFVDLSASPVKFEPFVICIEGPSGIGKSFLVEAMVDRMLAAIGYQDVNPSRIYTRCPGSKFWSGFRGQPVVLYDDWMNLCTPEDMVQQVAELYQLKTTATFMPEMAHLEEKRMQANPLIVVLVTNGAFPGGLSNIAPYPEAVFRRRNLVVKTSFAEGATRETVSALSREEGETFMHLKFSKYADVTDRTSVSRESIGWDRFSDWVSNKFGRYYEKELVHVRARMENLRNRLQLADGDMLDFTDPFRLLYGATTGIMQDPELGGQSYYPSEQLEAMVVDLVENMRVAALEEHLVIRPEPDDPFSQIEWSEVVRFFAAGVCSSVTTVWASMTCLKTVFEWITLRIGQLTSVFPEAECCVCRETGPIKFCCRPSMNAENPHWLCANCRSSSVGAGHPECPLCRDADVIVVMRPVGGILCGAILKSFGSVLEGGMNFLNEFVRTSNAMMGVRFVSILSSVLTAVQLIRCHMTGIAGSTSYVLGHVVSDVLGDVFYDAEDHVPTRSAMRMGVTATTIFAPALVTAQIENGGFEEEDDLQPTGSVVLDAVFEVDLNMRTIEGICRQVVVRRSPRCYHHLLEGDLGLVAAKDEENWQVPLRRGNVDQWVCVPDAPCGEDCIWLQDIGKQVQFYSRYLEANKQRIGRDQMLVAQNGPNVELLISRIPRFCRPDWTSVDRELLQLATAQTWWQWLGEKFEMYKHILALLTGIGAAVAATLGIASWLSAPVYPVGHFQSPPQHGQRIMHGSRPATAVRVVQSEKELEGNSILPQLFKNYVLIKVMDGDHVDRQLIAIGIEKHLCAIPRHYVKYLRQAKSKGLRTFLESVRIMYSGKPPSLKEFEFVEENFNVCGKTDLALFKVPSSMPMFVDIRSKFCDEKTSLGMLPSDAVMLVPPTRKDPYLRVLDVGVRGIMPHLSIIDADDTTLILRDCLEYDYSQDGICGSLVVSKLRTGWLVAMHVAGCGVEFDGRGYGVPLTKELIDELVPRSPVVQFEEVSLESIENAKLLLEPEAMVEYVGTVASNKTMMCPRKSQILPSVIAPIAWKPTTEPVIMDKADSRYNHLQSPLVAGINQHGRPTLDFPQDWVEEAREALWLEKYCGLKPLVTAARKLTVDEAVEGLTEDYYGPMRLETSSGWPWSREVNGPKTTLKNMWLEDPEKRKVLDSEILRKENLRKAGVIPFTVFADLLKDERRFPAKARKLGGTRVFSASPLDYTIAMRQNLLHFCASFVKNRSDLMHSVGINVFGDEWTRLAQDMWTVEPNGFVALDYSNFGPRLNSCVAEAACKIMVDWTMLNVEGSNESELWALCWECIHSTHLAGNLVYKQMCGSPSGAAFTVVINSLVNQLYVMIAWKHLVGAVPGGCFKEFFRKVRLSVYGDDLLMTVHPSYESLFNGVTLVNFFALYGIVATDGEKTGVIKEREKFSEVRFLQRQFLRHPKRPGMFLAPLRKDRLEDIGLWIWPCNNLAEATRQNCEAMLLQSHGWGVEYFEELKKRTNDALIKKKIKPLTRSWNEIDHLFFETKFIPHHLLLNLM